MPSPLGYAKSIVVLGSVSVSSAFATVFSRMVIWSGVLYRQQVCSKANVIILQRLRV